MRNIKKIYGIIGIFIMVFLLFSFVKNVSAAEITLWKYTYSNGALLKTYDKFETEDKCNKERDSFILKNPIFKINVSDCESYISVGAPVTSAPYIVTPQFGQNITNSDTYKLLAPLGKDYTEVETNNIGKYFNIFFNLAIGLAGALAVIMLIIGGVQWMGTDSVFGKTESKKRITSAILGLLIALGSYALLNTINPDLLGKKGLKIDQVKIELEEEEIPWSTYSSGGNLKLCPEGFIDVLDGNQGKINVCKTLESDLIKLIATAKSEGVILSGYGSRSEGQQRDLRIKNKCPDIENSPAEDCDPPTARIGRSMHESGNAIDFRCNGKSMMESGGKNSPCFKWLASNASKYGLKNLSSEPWHWSTTGR